MCEIHNADDSEKYKNNIFRLLPSFQDLSQSKLENRPSVIDFDQEIRRRMRLRVSGLTPK